MTGGVYWSIIIDVLFFVSMQEAKESRKRITYFSTEHPRAVYFDTKYLSYINITSRRHSRADPFYYVDLHLNILVPVGDNVTVSFYFYELLTNVYKRGFIEMHKGVCNLILNDKFFGGAMKRNFNTTQLRCPFPKVVENEEMKYLDAKPIGRVSHKDVDCHIGWLLGSEFGQM
ncbi:uncharacterized protein LOC131851338 [Achroia grisella]|uniref:uncharacterized protein LOC131851338 n=1 Tax=Achroia grisella TaxID=688607 RepID=UPI0027D31FA6|nr:uncharacterized protein LOC131851338 [Achroia grisella]